MIEYQCKIIVAESCYVIQCQCTQSEMDALQGMGGDLRSEIDGGIASLSRQYTLPALHEAVKVWGERAKNVMLPLGVRRIASIVRDGLWGRRLEARVLIRESVELAGIALEHPMLFTPTAEEASALKRVVKQYDSRDDVSALYWRAWEALDGIYSDVELDLEIEFWGDRVVEIANPEWVVEMSRIVYQGLWNRRDNIFLDAECSLCRV